MQEKEEKENTAVKIKEQFHEYVLSIRKAQLYLYNM